MQALESDEKNTRSGSYSDSVSPNLKSPTGKRKNPDK